MHTIKRQKDDLTKVQCSECDSKLVIYQRGIITCRNCGHVIYDPKNDKKRNKYGAVRTVARDGLKRDSKFEASIADELWVRKQSGDILDYDTQFKVVMPIYDKDGEVVDKVTHKIDFRIHHKDGSYELYEAKGKETDDYKWRRRLLEKVWLPENLDHIYTVRKMNNYRRSKR